MAKRRRGALFSGAGGGGMPSERRTVSPGLAPAGLGSSAGLSTAAERPI